MENKTKGFLKNTDSEKDAFKETFKYYKSKYPPPSLTDVIDFRNNNAEISEDISAKIKMKEPCQFLGLKCISSWKMYTLKDKPGLLYIPNPFTAKGQRCWIKRCLQDYPKKPNKTNIDGEVLIDDWWSFCHESIDNSKKYLKKLRWTTLGYHHDWDTKVYTEKSHNIFPEDLARLCDALASYIGYERFIPQAAIVNYYHMDSTLSPHTDHSEVNLDAPLISISFGQSAIFLIGGPAKAHKPTALRLHSGDIVIMSKESRLSYHAVPKILPAIDASWNDTNDECNERSSKCLKNDNTDDIATKCNQENINWEHFDAYIKHSRININVRQVLNENQKNLTDR